MLNRIVELRCGFFRKESLLTTIDAVKRCRPGSSPRLITDEQPVPEPARPPRRRPEPIGDSEESEPTYSPARTPTERVTERSLPPASELRSVGTSTVAGALRIRVDTNGAVQFKDFTLTSPSRIVIDLAGIQPTGEQDHPVELAWLIGSGSATLDRRCADCDRRG